MARINRNLTKDRAEAWAIRLAIFVLKLLPFAARKRVAGWLMQQSVRNIRALRKRVDTNLTYVLPGLSADSHAELAGEVGSSIGISMIEIFSSSDFQRTGSHFNLAGAGLDALKRDQAAGKGAILVSGHFGQWEAIRIALRDQGITCGGVYRPNNNVFYDRDFHAALETFGKPIFPNTGAGTRALIRHVSQGGVVMMLLDQHIMGTPTLSFFGKPAKTATIAADLARKFDLPLIACYGIRRSESPIIDVILEAPIPHADPMTMTQALNDSLEARIRANPGQYYWLHQRWRNLAPKQPPSTPVPSPD